MSFLSTVEELEMFPNPLLGKVTMTIAPNRRGRVECGATTWSAEFYRSGYTSSILPGESVMVLARRGNTLLIMGNQRKAVSMSVSHVSA